tara:strand:- start:128 stop:367 length:240 start_codon:yes stop_codon:yes gene_type:complete
VTHIDAIDAMNLAGKAAGLSKGNWNTLYLEKLNELGYDIKENSSEYCEHPWAPIPMKEEYMYPYPSVVVPMKKQLDESK